MHKKHFIALADAIKAHNALFLRAGQESEIFTYAQRSALADACQKQNPNFNRERWLSYIAGECGPNGGKI